MQLPQFTGRIQTNIQRYIAVRTLSMCHSNNWRIEECTVPSSHRDNNPTQDLPICEAKKKPDVDNDESNRCSKQ